MKKILTVVTLLLFGLGLGAQEIGCSFVQNKTFKSNGKTERSEGIAFYTAPDHLRLNYLDPKGDYLIIDGDMLRTRRANKASDIDTSKNPALRAFSHALMNCVTGNCDAIAREMDADLSVSESDGKKTAVITARNTASRGIAKVTVTYDAKNRPVRIVLDEFNGVSTEYLVEY